MKFTFTKNKDFSLYLYKVLHDALVLLLFFFAVAFLFDSILPGLISEHVSFLKLFLFIVVTLLLTAQIAVKNDVDYNLSKIKKRKVLTSFLSLFFLATLLVCLRKFFNFEIAIITTTSFAIMIYFYKILIHKN